MNGNLLARGYRIKVKKGKALKPTFYVWAYFKLNRIAVIFYVILHSFSNNFVTLNF